MKPDASRYNPEPAYLRSLIERTGLSQAKCAVQCGYAPRVMRKHLRTDKIGDYVPISYAGQFALECLVLSLEKSRNEDHKREAVNHAPSGAE